MMCMRVRDWMNTDYPYFKADLTVGEVRERINALEIPLVVCVDGERKLVGTTHKGDLLNAPDDTVLSELVKMPDYYVGANSFVEDAVVFLSESKEFALPVLDDDMRVLGVLTVFEVLEFLMEAAAIGERGARISVSLTDIPGSLKKVVDVLSESDINILSILTYPEDGGKRRVILRVDATDVDYLGRLLKRSSIEVDSIIAEEGFGG